jgi:glycosyltransferase involved in cell wall biosynthesis
VKGAAGMRVLMTADAVGGVWTYAMELARALGRDHRIAVTLATMGPPPSKRQAAEAAAIPDLELVTGGFRLEWMDDAWRDAGAAGQWLLDVAHTSSASLVHLNGYVHAALPWPQPVLVAGHSCCVSWAAAVHRGVDGSAAGGTLGGYRAAVRGGLRAADWVVAPSRAMLASLERWYGPLAQSSGRSTRLFRPGRKERFVFAAGRLWDEAKNVSAVVSVAPRLRWPVAVAGPAAIGSADRVRLPGVRHVGALESDEMSSWLARAAIFAAPARYEPFGLLALEAALSGCALVLGDIDSLREVWGDAADFVPPDDHDALHDAIAALIASPDRLVKRGLAARARAVQFTPERMASAYADLYQALASRAGASARRVPCAS